MKNKIAKIISLCLCTAIVSCTAVYALGSNEGGRSAVSITLKSADGAAGNASENTAGKLTSGTTNKTSESVAGENDTFKDESVYVIAGADGTVQKIIVSDWIKNTLSKEKINDVTELKNIENVKGNESYTLGGNNTCIWDAKGNDIYYQGTIEKELPVKLSVSYKLEGKTVSPEELAGKSGKVTIRFDYENKRYEKVKIGDKDETIYVPFTMMTGLVFDNSKFSDIKVSNGKIINDGDRTIVIGFALPGLQENLSMGKEKLEIPSYVEVTADTTDFSLGNTVTVATNTLFSNLDEEKINSISDLAASASELNDAMAKLLDGSSALYSGLCTLLDKSTELIQGINQLASGASALKDGAYSLDDGAAKLSDGVAALSDGLDKLSSNNDTLTEGAGKIFESLLYTAKEQLTTAGLSVPELTIDNYASVLNGIIDSLNKKIYDQALSQVTSAIEEKRDYIRAQVADVVRKEVESGVTSSVKERVTEQVTNAVKEQVSEQVTEAVRENVKSQVILALAGMDKAYYDAAVSSGLVDKAVQDAVNAAINEKMASEETAAIISSNTDSRMKSQEVSAAIEQKINEQMESEEVKNIIKTQTDSKMTEPDIQSLIAQNTESQIQKAITENMASQEVQSKIAAASESVKSIVSLKDSLDSYNAFYLGLKDYTAGVAQAASGASDLKIGTVELKNGSKALCDGVYSLYEGILAIDNGAPALIDGITQLKDGSLQLSDGLSQLNEEGIQKLIDKVGNADNLIRRIKATITVSKNYKSFAGISGDADGNVRFIYRTGEIK